MIQRQQLTHKHHQHLFSRPIVLLCRLCRSERLCNQQSHNPCIFLLAAIVPSLPITHAATLLQQLICIAHSICVRMCVCLHVFLYFSPAIIQSLSIRDSMRARAQRGESEDSRGRPGFLIEHLMIVNGWPFVPKGIGKWELIIVQR